MNTYGLNIHLISFYLNRNIVLPNDTIRVSITTIPEENKEAFVVTVDKSNDIHHFFTVNVTGETKKIIFVLRRKNLFSNHIIASTIVPYDELPKSESDTNNTEVKTIKLYEPFQHLNNNQWAVQNRRVLGEMKIQIKPAEAFPKSSIEDNYNNYKKKTVNNRHTTVNVSSVNNRNYMNYGYYSNENQNDYQSYNQNNYQKQNCDQFQNDQQNQFCDNQYQQPMMQQNQYDNNQYQQQPMQNQFNNNQYQQQQNEFNNNLYQQQPVQNQFNNNQYQQQNVQQQNQQQVPAQQQNQMIFVNDLI